ncbi:MAG: cation diffusion facilitator family transporter [Actinobacteria bacterium]|nr:cation diffusion facilitator family transporter [Actinomycetota bacterium]
MRKAQNAAIVSTVFYLALAALLFAGGVIDGSKGLIFGGLLISARFASEVMIILGMRVSYLQTKKFPFGLYKLENLVAALTGGVLLVIAYELAKYSFFSIPRYGMKTTEPQLVIPILAVCALTGLALAIYKKHMGKMVNSPSLAADARNSFADFIVLTIVIAGMFLEIAGIRWMEELVVLLGSVYMLWVGGSLVFYSLQVLLDATIDSDILETAKKVAASNPLVTRVLDVKGTNSGSRRFIDLSIVLFTPDLREARKIAAEIEQGIAGVIPSVERVTVHFEAKPRELLLFALPAYENGRAFLSFEDAPYLTLIEGRDAGEAVVTTNRIINPVRGGSRERGVRLAVALDKLGIDAVLLPSPVLNKDTKTALEVFGISIVALDNLDDMQEAEESIKNNIAGFMRRKPGGKVAAL